MRKNSLRRYIVFEKEVISHSNVKRLQSWSPFLGIWKRKNLCSKFFFLFFHHTLATLMTNWVQIFHRFVFMFGKHQVRLLAFDNYKRCPVSLRSAIPAQHSFLSHSFLDGFATMVPHQSLPPSHSIPVTQRQSTRPMDRQSLGWTTMVTQLSWLPTPTAVYWWTCDLEEPVVVSNMATERAPWVQMQLYHGSRVPQKRPIL